MRVVQERLEHSVIVIQSYFLNYETVHIQPVTFYFSIKYFLYMDILTHHDTSAEEPS